MRQIQVVNTLTGKKEPLKTQKPNLLTFYSCGPTVYNLIHIGNLRSALVADLFFRTFRRVGYKVSYVRNYTDIDDKIINRAREENTTAQKVAEKYTQEVEKDFIVAGVLEPTHKVKATDHIPEMIQMIQDLVDRKFAYVIEGEVLYSIEKFADYGKLAHRNTEDLKAGFRVEIDPRKKNPLDFTLWKPAKPGEPSWESPWGPGRPGWHIECSAMAKKWLGPSIDVHHGGEDLIFPHHQNEVAQSEGATGKKPFVQYWLHHAFVNIQKEKMSKSLGNVLLARDFLTEFGTEVTRAFLLSVHYRSIIDFTEEGVLSTVRSLERLYEAKQKALELRSKKYRLPDARVEGLWGSFIASCGNAKDEIDAALANDFNTPEVFSVVFTLIRQFNHVLQEPRAEHTPAAAMAAEALKIVLEQDLGEVLGVGQANPNSILEQLSQIRGKRHQAEGTQKLEPAEIEALIEKRNQARAQKDFAKSDEIRKDLEAKGVVLKDGPQGTRWSYR